MCLFLFEQIEEKRHVNDEQHRAHARRMCVMTIDAIDAKDMLDIANTPIPWEN